MDVIKEFYELANTYCGLITENEITDESIPALIELLMKLYISALNLPDSDPDTSDHFSTIETDFRPIRIGDQLPQLYWKVYDPFENDEPVCGYLTDDLTDIAIDLKSGIAEYEAGNIGNAVFEWKFGLNNHWGYHVVDALRALHYFKND